MRAIDILFDEIDKLNSKLKKEDDMGKKIVLAFQIGKIVEIIGGIEALRIQSGNNERI